MFQRDTQKRFHSGVGIARNGAAIFGVGHKISGSDQTDIIDFGNLGQRGFNRVNLVGLHILEAGKHDDLILRQHGYVGQIRFRYQVKRQPSLTGLILGRHEQLAISRLVIEIIRGGFRINNRNTLRG